MTSDEHSMMGHNGGPPMVDDPAVAAFAKIDGLYDEAKNWADGTPIESQKMHDAASTLYEQLHEAGKVAEALRVAAKKPLDDAVKELQARFNPYIQDKRGKVSLGKDALGIMLAVWRKKVADEKAERARKAADEAAALQAAAQEAMQSSSGNLEARERAEEAVTLAKDATRYAKKQERAAVTGNGLRSVWSATLVDLPDGLDWAYSAHRASFEDFVIGLADTAVKNGARQIPGFVIREEKVATV